MKFQLHSPFKPTGDQPQAIKTLCTGLKSGLKHQVLVGVTGSGKTFTMANVIAQIQRPTLVISHNKTLAAQLYQEFKSFFPHNAVCYFVSYYDYYQPEAYIPQTDTYIEKETEINEEIDKLRLAATTNLLTRNDTIIVASVSCVYNIGSPKEYGHFILELKPGILLSREAVVKRLVDLQYTRDNYNFQRGTFRVIGEIIDIYPAYEDTALRIIFSQNKIINIEKIEPISGVTVDSLYGTVIYPAKHYMTDPKKYEEIFKEIRKDLKKRLIELKKKGKDLEARRLEQKVNYDLEMISQVGYVNGIENYSRYFDGREKGEPPWTLLDYFKEPYGDDWLLFVDESHMTIPQIRGMFHGDQSRKKTLIDYGFRLPSALDNRPLTFAEFMQRIPQTIYVSATPDDWEQKLAEQTVEQFVRPTGIVDPKIFIRPTKGQIADLEREIRKRKANNERVLVTTLTKKTAEALTKFLNERHVNGEICVAYIHSDIETLERTNILDNLRMGKYDVLIGINLLREGLDLPEVSLVAILDADKEGFLRSKVSLIQTMGRAARHACGSVILYADTITKSIKEAVEEIEYRRKRQLAYNREHNIIPQTIIRPIREKIAEEKKEMFQSYFEVRKREEYNKLLEVDIDGLTPFDKRKYVKKLQKEMRLAATQLNFELAAEIRDKIKKLSTFSEGDFHAG